MIMLNNQGFPGGASCKEPTVNARHSGDVGSILGGKTPWRRAWQPTPIFMPGEPHGQRRLAGYVP